MVIEEHHHHEDSGSGNGIAWVVLLIVVALIAWFVFRAGGIGSPKNDINITIPSPTQGTTGDTSSGTGE